MDQEQQWLFDKNVEMGDHEAAGNKLFFEELLATAFAFMRTDGRIVDRQKFLDELKPSARRKTTVISISFLGNNRALITAIVAMDERKFHNIRLFVRQPGQQWRLLGQANEEIKS